MAKFNKERALNDARRDVVKEGLHAGVITSLDYQTVEEGDTAGTLRLAVVASVLKDIEDPNSVVQTGEVRTWPELPLDNDDYPGHTYSKWAMNKWQPLAAALFPDDCPAKPSKKRRGKNEPTYFRGEEIDQDSYQECLDETVVAAGEKAQELAEATDAGDNENGFASMVGTPFWMLVKHREGSDFVNMIPFSAEEPPTDLKTGEPLELVDPEDCITKAGGVKAAAASDDDDESPKKRGARKKKTSRRKK